MSIPFKPIDSDEPSAPAAYLRVVRRADDELIGALFVMNARGEPIEFAYSKAEMPGSFLWRPRDLERAAILGLVTILFEAATTTPVLVLCLASEVPVEILQRDLAIGVPTIRVAPAGERLAITGSEQADRLESSEPIDLAWHPKRPDVEHPAGVLFAKLAERGLIREPFERMLGAMDEVIRPASAVAG